jgi:hypothetical protein
MSIRAPQHGLVEHDGPPGRAAPVHRAWPTAQARPVEPLSVSGRPRKHGLSSRPGQLATRVHARQHRRRIAKEGEGVRLSRREGERELEAPCGGEEDEAVVTA